MTTPLSEAQSLPRKPPTKANATYIQYLTLSDVSPHAQLITALLDELTQAVGRNITEGQVLDEIGRAHV